MENQRVGQGSNFKVVNAFLDGYILGVISVVK